VAGSVDVRSAPGKLGALARWQGRCGLEARAGAVSKRDRTRKGMNGMPRGMSRTAAQIDVAFPGGSPARARPLDADRSTVRRGERAASSKCRFSPRVSISGCRLRHRTPSASRARKQSERLAKGGQLGRRRKTRTGSCSERRGVPYRKKASRVVASRSFHEGRWKRSRSHGHYANRPATAEA
jgi:hypothetical protein